MKQTLLFIALVSCILAPVYAEFPCQNTQNKALDLFHSAKYYQAKQLFLQVSDNCGRNYQNVDAMLQLCDAAISKTDTVLLIDNSRDEVSYRYLEAKSSSISFDVICYGDYNIVEIPNWCKLANYDASSFSIKYSANNTYEARTGVIYIEGGKTKMAIILAQEGIEHVYSEPEVVESIESVQEPTPSPIKQTKYVAPLHVNRTSISVTSNSIVEYVDVTCGKEWEIQYPNGSFYTATKMGDYVKVVIKANNTYAARSDYFYVRTTDQKESKKITISQTPNLTNTNTSTTTYQTSRNTYQQYCDYMGNVEVTWFGMRAGICTGVSYGYRLFSLRFGPVQLNPIEFTADYNFFTEEIAAIYTPSVDFVVPIQEDVAFYFGGGPSIHITDYTYVWADVSAGFHWHWGDFASSDFFVRYNGSFMFGISLQWSSGY